MSVNINTYVYSIDEHVDVEVSVSDFLDECSRNELEQVVEYIAENAPELLDVQADSILGNLQIEYKNKFNGLIDYVYKFTSDEEQFLNDIFKKYL